MEHHESLADKRSSSKFQQKTRLSKDEVDSLCQAPQAIVLPFRQVSEIQTELRRRRDGKH
jgi:hypothetical protein